MNSDFLDKLYQLYKNFIKLKGSKRRGWYLRDIKDGESIAEHSFSTALLGMFISDYLKLNTEKVVKMALLHEFCEIITGDITPVDNISQEKKQKMEHEAVKSIFNDFPNGTYYIQLWEEFEFAKSMEGKLVKDLDKFEMALQAIEYDKNYNHFSMDEFIQSALKNIKDPKLKKFLKEHIK